MCRVPLYLTSMATTIEARRSIESLIARSKPVTILKIRSSIYELTTAIHLSVSYLLYADITMDVTQAERIVAQMLLYCGLSSGKAHI